MRESLVSCVRYDAKCGKYLFAAVAFLFLTCSPLHAQLSFNSGNFGTVGFSQNAFSLTPSGGTGNYTFSYAPGAATIPGFRVTNRPNVPNFFSAGSTGGLVGIAAVPGTYSTTIRLTDNGSALFVDKAVSFTVTTVDIAGGPQSGYGVGDTVSFPFWGVGGTGLPYTFSLASGTLPPGLTLNSSTTAIDGLLKLEGTLTTA